MALVRGGRRVHLVHRSLVYYVWYGGYFLFDGNDSVPLILLSGWREDPGLDCTRILICYLRFVLFLHTGTSTVLSQCSIDSLCFFEDANSFGPLG